MEVVKPSKAIKHPELKLMESNELAILVSTQPWTSDSSPVETRGRRILWPLMSPADSDDESPFSL